MPCGGPLVCLCFAHGIAFNRYASKLLPYSRDSKPHAVKLYAVTAPRLLLYYASLHQIARWNFAQNSSDFVGLLCTIFYTIYIIIGVRLVWTNPAILFTMGKHSLFGILRHLHALLGYSSIITLDAQKNAVHAICIFYTLQYSMVLLYFCNLSFAFGVIVLQMQHKTDSSMRILDRMMYIDILFRCNNSYACPACKH